MKTKLSGEIMVADKKVELMSMEEISEELSDLIDGKKPFSINRLLELKSSQETHSSVNVMGMILLDSIRNNAFKITNKEGMECLSTLIATVKDASVLPADLKREIYEHVQKTLDGF